MEVNKTSRIPVSLGDSKTSKPKSAQPSGISRTLSVGSDIPEGSTEGLSTPSSMTSISTLMEVLAELALPPPPRKPPTTVIQRDSTSLMNVPVFGDPINLEMLMKTYPLWDRGRKAFIEWPSPGSQHSQRVGNDVITVRATACGSDCVYELFRNKELARTLCTRRGVGSAPSCDFNRLTINPPGSWRPSKEPHDICSPLVDQHSGRAVDLANALHKIMACKMVDRQSDWIFWLELQLGLRGEAVMAGKGGARKRGKAQSQPVYQAFESDRSIILFGKDAVLHADLIEPELSRSFVLKEASSLERRPELQLKSIVALPLHFPITDNPAAALQSTISFLRRSEDLDRVEFLAMDQNRIVHDRLASLLQIHYSAGDVAELCVDHTGTHRTLWHYEPKQRLRDPSPRPPPPLPNPKSAEFDRWHIHEQLAKIHQLSKGSSSQVKVKSLNDPRLEHIAMVANPSWRPEKKHKTATASARSALSQSMSTSRQSLRMSSTDITKDSPQPSRYSSLTDMAGGRHTGSHSSLNKMGKSSSQLSINNLGAAGGAAPRRSSVSKMARSSSQLSINNTSRTRRPSPGRNVPMGPLSSFRSSIPKNANKTKYSAK